MLTISCKQMQAMDAYAIKEIGIPSIVLMENAALKVVSNLDLNQINKFVVVCGIGNNGGDGLAIARHLIFKNKQVDLFIIGNLDQATKDFKVNLNILEKLDVKIKLINNKDKLKKLEKALENSELLIDSIFGIGIDRNVEGLYYDVIKLINNKSLKVLSVDTPSGLDADSGDIFKIAIKANKTITFHQMKKGLLKNQTYTGAIIVADIGIPKRATEFVIKQTL